MSAHTDPWLYAALARLGELLPGLPPAWLDTLPGQVPPAWFNDRRRPAWETALASLPVPGQCTLRVGESVALCSATALDAAARDAVHAALMALHPWRKGPFSILGVEVDAEWHSPLKWARVAPHLRPLAGRRVLDVGCGNGWYAWRMWAAGARCVVGFDPAPLAVMQFRALARYLPAAAVVVLPVPSAVLDRSLAAFDTVFSMGVLYHRRDPLAHLRELRRAMVDGGELVVETLVVSDRDLLEPGGRYARMSNVWAIPSPQRLLCWLYECGFESARVVDLAPTTPREQRSTPWMQYESLAECLDPRDATRTVEGYPAPLRAVVVATAC